MSDPNLRIVGAASYSQLQELVQRLWFHGESSTHAKGESLIFVGELPKQLPVEIPIPDRTRVVGAVFNSNNNVEMVLDVGMPPEEVRLFYVKKMLADGWNHPPSERQRGGFTGQATRQTETFCFSTKGPMLHVAVQPIDETTSDLRLYLHLEERDQCDPESELSHIEQSRSVIPSLHAPSGSWRMGGGGSAITKDQHSSSGRLQTEMKLDEILDHYAEQLQRAGWKRLDSVQGRFMASANWSFRDEGGNQWGALFIARKPEPHSDVCFVHVSADRI